MKITVCKFQPKFISYRKYKHFFNNTFKDTILEEFCQIQISSNDGYNTFLRIC